MTLLDATRAFAGRRVLGPVTLSLEAATVAVVVGANGAGKTTLLRLAAGLLAPTSGSAHRAGRSVYLRPGAGARHAVTVRRALTDLTRLAGTPAATTGALVDELCELTGIAGLIDHRVGELSAGQHARLTAALAVAAKPSLACLDEPTAHLDPDGVHHVTAAVRRLTANGAAVLLTSHSPDEVGPVADAVLQLRTGHLSEIRC